MAFVCFADQICCRRKSILSHHEIECCCEFSINHIFCHKYRQKVCVEWWNSENIHATLLLFLQLPSFEHLIRFHMVMYCYRYREAKSFSFWFFWLSFDLCVWFKNDWEVIKWKILFPKTLPTIPDGTRFVALYKVRRAHLNNWTSKIGSLGFCCVWIWLVSNKVV